jgi:ubiquinone/menaquinone biosynthesis C-methylase UbiE
MNTVVLESPSQQAEVPAAPDYAAIKKRQQATWASGDFAVVGVTLQIVGESLAEAADIRSGERVLDVAAGNGNATLAAARRFAEVTSTDYVPALLDKGHARAKAEGLLVNFRVADVEALPFQDASFDAVLSTYGVMFAPDHVRAAREMLRVVRPGGRIGMANWTPDGFVGQLFKTIGKHAPPPPGVKSPALWGTQPYLAQLFGAGSSIHITNREFMMRYRSAQHWTDVFRNYYGPVHKTFGALPPAGQVALLADLFALIERFNRATDGTMVVPCEYLEVVITRR